MPWNRNTSYASGGMVGSGRKLEDGATALRRRRRMKTLRNPADRNEISKRIAELTTADRAHWGKMNAHQMMCHLRDSYQAGLGERYCSPLRGFLPRTIMKKIALQVPIRWAKNYPTRPEVKQGDGGSVPADFETDRRSLTETFARFSEVAGKTPVSHPIFGTMSQDDWLRWGYLHADHHLRQFGR